MKRKRMQETVRENFPEVKKAIRKKRSKYMKFPKERKRELIFRVIVLNEETKTACQELGFNFSTGRNLIQKYKKTGDYGHSQDLPFSPSKSSGGGCDSATEFEGRKSKCPLGLVLYGEDDMKLVPSKSYQPEEELAMLRLHSYLSNFLVSS